jgi:hypothetical protein
MSKIQLEDIKKTGSHFPPFQPPSRREHSRYTKGKGIDEICQLLETRTYTANMIRQVTLIKRLAGRAICLSDLLGELGEDGLALKFLRGRNHVLSQDVRAQLYYQSIIF